MTARGGDFARLAGATMAHASPTFWHLRPLLVRLVLALLAALPLLLAAAAVDYLLMQWALLVLGLGVATMVGYLLRPHALMDRLHWVRWSACRRDLRASSYVRGGETAASGVTVGQWVCRQSEYEQQRRAGRCVVAQRPGYSSRTSW
jgi:hypothetical protein